MTRHGADALSGYLTPRERFARGGGLYLIVTAPAIAHRDLVAAAVERAVPVVQLREKSMEFGELVDLAGALVEITRGSETLLVVNDRPDVALAVGADGAHVGALDVPAHEVRLLLGDGALVGVSGSSPEEARAAVGAGADYLGVAPVFRTATKADAGEPLGLDSLRAIAETVPRFPLVAVGGVDLARARSVLDAGAAYAGVVSAICHAEDPITALDAFARRLRPAR